MKTKEQIERKMKALSNEYNKEDRAHFALIKKDAQQAFKEHDESWVRYMTGIRDELRVLQWVSGIKFDKFIDKRFK
jgi:hypothetical protein